MRAQHLDLCGRLPVPGGSLATEALPLATDLLAEAESHWRLLENIPAEIGVFDPRGRFLFNTPSGIRDPAMRQWVLGKTHHDYCRQRKYPLAIADRRQAAIETVVAERRCVSFEELWVDKTGCERFYVRTFSPVLDGDGAVTHVIGYGQEITALKGAEQALRKAHDELQEEVLVRKQAEEDLRRALDEVEALKDRLHAENAYLQEEIKTQHNFEEILGQSPALLETLRAVETVAPTEANVLIQGETGTGKELIARAIHAASRRREKALIKVNCAAVPDSLFESEFFGHVRGAFTGAVKDRAGRFELADGGTLFLDEVGEIPPAMQSKLLRVLQEGEFERVGSAKTSTVNVRIVAATNRDLKREVGAGRFREDLYYRLSVFPIPVAPLRDRPEDVPLLARHYLERGARKLRQPVRALTPEQVRQLQRYDWPGNVRELENVIERALITARGGGVRFQLPAVATNGAVSAEDRNAGRGVVPEAEIRRRERENLLAALRRADWRIHGPRGAARLLGVKPTTLASRIKKLGLERPNA